MILITENVQNPRHNLAREEVLLNHVEEDTVYLWRNSPSVIVGRHQNTAAEADEVFAREHGVEIVRRLTGGGAVFHDPGNINMSFLFRGGVFEEKAEQGLQLLLRFLREQGAQVGRTGRNDICTEVGGRMLKIGGCAATQRGERGLFHSCLLYSCDLSAMERVLTPSAEKLSAKGVKSVRSRVINLSEMLGEENAPSCEEFFRRMEAFFAGFCRRVPLSEAERRETALLQRERYARWAWNFGRNPAGSVSGRASFPIGQVQIDLDLERGKIGDCRFSGDYFMNCDLDEIAARMKGTVYSRSAVEKALGGIDFQTAFGTEDREKVLNFLMGGGI